MSRFTTATLALLLAPGLLQAAAPQTLWDFAPSSHIRRIAAEKGAPANSQPLKVDAATLARALGGVRFMAKADKEELLFIPSEAVAIGDAMGEALALAQPGEDLELLSAANRGRGVFSSNRTVTARVFVLDGKLNLIVHDTRLEWLYYPSLTDNRMPTFDFGSRAKAGDAVLKAPGAEVRRADWVVLPLTAPAPAAQPPAAPLPAAQPPSSRSLTVEEHLRDLKRFRDQGLITEDEYAKEKQELLKGFAKDAQ
jgi:hypothetical protein